MNKEDLDEMSDAYAKVDHNIKFGSLIGTGIKLKAFNTTTNKPTTSGLMLSNSDMEILALSDVKVEVVGYKELKAKYFEAIEALKVAKLQLEYLDEKFTRTGTTMQTLVLIDNILAKVEVKNE